MILSFLAPIFPESLSGYNLKSCCLPGPWWFHSGHRPYRRRW